MPTNAKNRIRICADCKQAPAKGIRSKRCLECHQKHLKAKTNKWNAERSRKARENWSPICEYPGCEALKRSNRIATKWCEHHRKVVAYEHQQGYRRRVIEQKIANPGKCQNPGCDKNAFSYKAKYCSKCRKEVHSASKKVYHLTQYEKQNEKNVQIIQYVRDVLNQVVNDAAQTGRLDTPECHRMGTILLQLRSWKSK